MATHRYTKYANYVRADSACFTGRQEVIHDGREYDQEQLDFIKAIDRRRTQKRSPFLPWTEVLEIVKSLGYKKDKPKKKKRKKR